MTQFSAEHLVDSSMTEQTPVIDFNAERVVAVPQGLITGGSEGQPAVFTGVADTEVLLPAGMLVTDTAIDDQSHPAQPIRFGESVDDLVVGYVDREGVLKTFNERDFDEAGQPKVPRLVARRLKNIAEEVAAEQDQPVEDVPSPWGAYGDVEPSKVITDLERQDIMAYEQDAQAARQAQVRGLARAIEAEKHIRAQAKLIGERRQAREQLERAAAATPDPVVALMQLGTWEAPYMDDAFKRRQAN